MSLPLNAAIRDIPMPIRLRHRPVSATGFPVPWFVQWIDGAPDFRVLDAGKLRRAMRLDLCWLCGQTLGRFKCFVAGPMCAVNRTSAEPPSHRDCAEYALQACPFLAKPRMRRNEIDLPPDHIEPGGVMLKRNPGVALLWITHDYRVIRTATAPLIRMGEPVEIVAYAEGRLATRAELDESIMSGLPLLARECGGEDEQRALAAAVERTAQLFKVKLRVAA
jgi:hypothetical protein